MKEEIFEILNNELYDSATGSISTATEKIAALIEKRCIEFMKWRSDEMWFENLTGKYFQHKGNHIITEPITIEQLFQQFLTSKNN